MKKLLFAIAGAAAFSAFAADPSAGANDISLVGFENYTVDQTVIGYGDNGQEGGSLWSCEGDDASLVKTLGGDNAAVPSITEPRPFAGETNTKYLALDTSGAELKRAIPAAGQAVAADGTYIDTLVQFTPSESDPTSEDLTGAKLAIWLKVDNNVTNLMVAGGQYSAASTDDEDITVTAKSYKLSGSYEQNTWYRLTVKAIKTIAGAGWEGSDYSGFQIFIDGTLLTIVGDSAYDTESAALDWFADGVMSDTSILTGGTFIPSADTTLAAPTLTSVGFKGTGALDDFVVTTAEPDFTPAGGDDYKVEIAGSDVVITPQEGDLAAVQAAVIAGGGTLDVTDVDAVNAALAAPIGTTGIPSWQALFLGLPPTEAGLESFKIDSISFDEDGNVVVELPDDVDPKTGRGVNITIKLKSADTPNAVDWTDVESASGTTFAPFAPGSTDTKKFYKVVVEFAATPAQN